MRFEQITYLLGISLFLSFYSCSPEKRITKTPPADLYHSTIGQGPPILFIHGGPGLGSYYLEEHLQSLSSDYTLIFYDQRNSGRSPLQPDTSKVRLQYFLRDISDLLDYYGHEKEVICGHSWGGRPKTRANSRLSGRPTVALAAIV